MEKDISCKQLSKVEWLYLYHTKQTLRQKFLLTKTKKDIHNKCVNSSGRRNNYTHICTYQKSSRIYEGNIDITKGRNSSTVIVRNFNTLIFNNGQNIQIEYQYRNTGLNIINQLNLIYIYTVDPSIQTQVSMLRSTFMQIFFNRKYLCTTWSMIGCIHRCEGATDAEDQL